QVDHSYTKVDISVLPSRSKFLALSCILFYNIVFSSSATVYGDPDMIP
ncbi:21749_t:CDS:2, partial [Entrophospora sp. SA101]